MKCRMVSGLSQRLSLVPRGSTGDLGLFPVTRSYSTCGDAVPCNLWAGEQTLVVSGLSLQLSDGLKEDALAVSS